MKYLSVLIKASLALDASRWDFLNRLFDKPQINHFRKTVTSKLIRKDVFFEVTFPGDIDRDSGTPFRSGFSLFFTDWQRHFNVNLYDISGHFELVMNICQNSIFTKHTYRV